MKTTIKKICNGDNITSPFNLKFDHTKVTVCDYRQNQKLLFEYKDDGPPDSIIRDFNYTGLSSTHLSLGYAEKFIENEILDIDPDLPIIIMFLSPFEYTFYADYDLEVATSKILNIDYRPLVDYNKIVTDKGTFTHLTISRKQKQFKAQISILYENHYLLIDFLEPYEGCFEV
ncbi:MAG TPA: hypothetical protein PLB59_01955 [Bacteroidales bacterium]|nr:hypothetical protein [Bacteroidales bacterium]HQP14706.1 hypothetical protein [Bacteroidales bacterium]